MTIYRVIFYSAITLTNTWSSQLVDSTSKVVGRGNTEINCHGMSRQIWQQLYTTAIWRRLSNIQSLNIILLYLFGFHCVTFMKVKVCLSMLIFFSSLKATVPECLTGDQYWQRNKIKGKIWRRFSDNENCVN